MTKSYHSDTAVGDHMKVYHAWVNIGKLTSCQLIAENRSTTWEKSSLNGKGET